MIKTMFVFLSSLLTHMNNLLAIYLPTYLYLYLLPCLPSPS